MGLPSTHIDRNDDNDEDDITADQRSYSGQRICMTYYTCFTYVCRTSIIGYIRVRNAVNGEEIGTSPSSLTAHN